MPTFNATTLPDNILRKMSPEDRKALGKAGLTLSEITTKQAMKDERKIHDQIESWLRQRDITFRHDRMDKRTTGTVGWPDFTFAVDGRAIALEVKLPGRRLTDEQRRCIVGLGLDGWLVRVVYSLADAVAAVREAQEKT